MYQLPFSATGALFGVESRDQKRTDYSRALSFFFCPAVEPPCGFRFRVVVYGAQLSKSLATEISTIPKRGEKMMWTSKQICFVPEVPLGGMTLVSKSRVNRIKIYFPVPGNVLPTISHSPKCSFGDALVSAIMAFSRYNFSVHKD